MVFNELSRNDESMNSDTALLEPERWASWSEEDESHSHETVKMIDVSPPFQVDNRAIGGIIMSSEASPIRES